MKQSVLVFFLLPVCYIYGQQQENKKIDLQELKKIEMVLPAPVEKINNSFFNDIKVIDARFDTSIAGFYGKQCFVFANNTGEALKKYLTQQFTMPDHPTGSQLVIYIKKLWLGKEIQSKNPGVLSYDHDDNWEGGITCKIECYNKNGDVYHPLFRLDTTIIERVSQISKNAAILVSTCLSIAANKIMNAYNRGTYNKTKGLSFEEINRYYTTRMAVPILKDTVLKKGVYANFAAFKNNTPTYTIYEITQRKLADIIHVKDSVKGELYPVRSVWGYCDGKQVFIKSADNYFPIYRINNSYYYNGAKAIQQIQPSRTENALTGQILFGNPTKHILNTNYKIKYNLYQIDMETGNVY